ncbi:DNA repair protein XRCC1-like [Anticarsia gemmatalis]|uniref:DNA repair protein XRCC1-like n=1 Tax=Anticarsia gemmatalis TaxID=129554 RepID=UPI003F75C1BD
MPRVKIDYVVSFSSEDPEHPASNLLALEVSKKKWLCKKGESQCSVLLQLNKAVKINSVQIGAYHAAFVEVLVSRSEKGNDQDQVLVPSCVLVSAAESRRDVPVERVRSFSAEQLAEARLQRWDRVRVVCTQPYNKHCKYGLSFIHINESGDGTDPPAPTATAPQSEVPLTAVPARTLALDTFSSDEDDFRPGELFAKHLQKNSDSQSSNSDTGAKIRQATSQALKNIPDTSTKLMKTPISKPTVKRDVPASDSKLDRTRDTLLYTDDDEKPHAKIDQVVQRHKDMRDKEDKNKVQGKHERKDQPKARKRVKSDTPPNESPPAKKVNSSGERSEQWTDDRKRARVSSAESDEAEDPNTILKDVVLVLSGYENPQRATVRNTALAMGARVERDWGPTCTHLICAFPNTPKLRAVRAAGGAAVPVVLAEWVLQCSARRRRLPWQWFATENKYRQPEPPASKTKRPAREKTPPRKQDSSTECDTDDEIEKVLQKQKAKQLATDAKRASPPRVPHTTVLEEGPATDEDEAADVEVPQFGGALPNFFDGYTFAIDADDEEVDTLARYVKAYGGLVMQLSELDEDSTVDYIIQARATDTSAGALPSARRVTAAWLARCHRAGELLPPD